jgi:ATP-dependent Clp protease protease subunit
MPLVPVVIEKEGNAERSYDIYSRLLKDRIIFVNGEIEDTMSAIIVAELLFLDSQDSEKPIHMYIQSPGGMVTAGLAIIDTMNLIKAPVYTYCVGMCASMGAMIFRNEERRTSQLVTIDCATAAINEKALDYDALNIQVSGNNVYMQTRNGVESCSGIGESISSVRLDTEYEDFLRLDNYIYLLGYDEVNRITYN